MKILFVQMATESPEGPVFPLGLAYLASVIGRDHEVRAVDMNVEAEPFQVIQAVGDVFKPDVVGLSFRNIKVAKPGEHISCVSELSGIVARVKRIIPQASIVLGGAAFSLYAHFFMRSIREIDFGVVGEGEIAFLELLKQFPNPSGIKGVCHRQDDTVVFQGTAERPSFADLPWPRRDLFRMEEYTGYPTSIGIMTKRGCPYRCVHCSDIYLLGKSIRLRPPEDVIEEMRFLHKEYNLDQFMFADQTFNMPVNYTKQLLRQMVKANLGVRWTAYFTPQGLDEEMVDLFKQAGCSIVSFSPDVCDDEVMAKLGKGFTVEDLYQANQLVRKAELPVTYNFMFGLPGETIRSLLQTLSFIFREKIRLGKFFQLHGLFIVPVRIYPHTELVKIALQEHVLADGDDLTEPRFYKHKSNLLNRLERFVLLVINSLWRLKHRISS